MDEPNELVEDLIHREKDYDTETIPRTRVIEVLRDRLTRTFEDMNEELEELGIKPTSISEILLAFGQAMFGAYHSNIFDEITEEESEEE